MAMRWKLCSETNGSLYLIPEAKLQGATYRVGPELEVPGYGCEDHFFELDTVQHSWECVAELLKDETTHGILCDVGLPVIHRGVLYNCRLFMLNSAVLLIRPKLALANDGNYREARYFSSWKQPGILEEFQLPSCILSVATNPSGTCPIGDGVLRLCDAVLAAETCEELFTPRSPHIGLALSGVEIISNGSGSHHQLRKLDQRLDLIKGATAKAGSEAGTDQGGHCKGKLDQRLELIKGATAKAGGVYLYANQRGCDGGRLYYDGCACVAVNGQLVAQGTQFGLADVEVLVVTVDLDEVVSYRSCISSLREQASCTPYPAYVSVPNFRLSSTAPLAASMRRSTHHDQKEGGCSSSSSLLLTATTAKDSSKAKAAAVAAGASVDSALLVAAGASVDSALLVAAGASSSSSSSQMPLVSVVSPPIQPRIHEPEEEIAFGPACWLWDYLRRSGASGFLLPLSGGADSSSTAAIVGAMCQLVVQYISQGNEQVLADARRIGQYGPDEAVDDAQKLAGRIFCTAYMGTVNSSTETRSRSKILASQVGSYHIELQVDMVVEALLTLFQSVTGRRPMFRVDGGSSSENLALQNIQARIRMVVAFLLAQLVPWVRGRSGFLLVLGSANVDECLRGYLTKYDCSSADINPIGGISKQDLRRFLRWGAVNLGYAELANVEAAPPTAELEPIREGQAPQRDEVDMGMTYEELSVFGRLRQIARCGPLSMFRRCLQMWGNMYTAKVIADKVKHFFRYYAINRHKTTVLTPSYHAESYSPDDNRFDHRPFLYNFAWPWQFRQIDDESAAGTHGA
ncbi:hypothetical protein CEUSTIGMA_g11612.t1 [Chlamydomonas eustigma]|uniref:Glutamine-dependent NAD(+) synthetase n=1 Tax=Chlamydomonas eustigma TaxID=1157962 RepID=A0A250XMN6_9CHLO|nr:hypothetical protein CEUSTIGMA_g11612.t1 [Chlamydomonas eustigma]|eukprot:GAX84189.1 hypothetical protein CEUSTIGMA_g11612.t1 [Chlamydomonas eustigma]